MKPRRLTTTFLAVLGVATAAVLAQAPAARDWPVYGADPGGSRYSPLDRITRDNVTKLVVAWRYHTGEPSFDLGRQPSLQVTPIVVDNVMYVSTPLGKVMALDPATGREIWRYDARVNPKGGYGDFANRGVATWVDPTLEARRAVPAPHLCWNGRRPVDLLGCGIGTSVRDVRRRRHYRS